jgi:hypothetical protein
MEVSYIYALTLAGRGLLIEPVPVAGSYAAQLFASHFFSKSKGKFTHGRFSLSERSALMDLTRKAIEQTSCQVGFH